MPFLVWGQRANSSAGRVKRNKRVYGFPSNWAHQQLSGELEGHVVFRLRATNQLEKGRGQEEYPFMFFQATGQFRNWVKNQRGLSCFVWGRQGNLRGDKCPFMVFQATDKSGTELGQRGTCLFSLRATMQLERGREWKGCPFIDFQATGHFRNWEVRKEKAISFFRLGQRCNLRGGGGKRNAQL